MIKGKITRIESEIFILLHKTNDYPAEPKLEMINTERGTYKEIAAILASRDLYTEFGQSASAVSRLHKFIQKNHGQAGKLYSSESNPNCFVGRIFFTNIVSHSIPPAYKYKKS